MRRERLVGSLEQDRRFEVENGAGVLTIVGIYHVIVLKGRLLVVVSPACGSHCVWGLRGTWEVSCGFGFI